MSDILTRRRVQVLSVRSLIAPWFGITMALSAQGSLMAANQPTIIEQKGFSSRNIPDISFRYPVFRGWEISRIDDSKANECQIFLHVPKGLKLDEPPHIRVARERGGFSLAGLPPQNTHGICYMPDDRMPYLPAAHGGSKYHFFPCDTPDSNVSVELSFDASEHGYSQELFWKSVIETFQRTSKKAKD
jgi:hypothetical protein